MPKLKTFTGEELLVDKDDYKRFKGMYISVRKGHPFIFQRRDVGLNKMVFLSRLVKNYEGHDPLVFLNGNTFDIRKSNLAIPQRKRLPKNPLVSSKWSALKQKLLCKSSGVVSS